MKNFTNDNLISINPLEASPGTLAIKIGENVFIGSQIKITQSSEPNQNENPENTSGLYNDLDLFDWAMILNNK